MTSPPLDPLRLDADQVRSTADFHEAYGRLVQPDAEDDSDFAALVEAASAFRLAGQWRLLVDPDAGVDLLLHAASLLSRAGLTYGAYLRASLAPDSCRDQLDSWTDRLLRTVGQPHGESELGFEERRPDEILDHVQQQTYLLLACARLTTPGSEQAAELRSFATESPHRDGVVPVGSMAMPVRTFWGLALDMLSPDDEPAAQSYAGTLTELSRAYARTVDLAMANTLTWFNAAAPIDVADLDVIGTMAMGVQHFGPDRMRDLLTTETAELPAVVLVPLNLGMRVIHEGPIGPDPRGPGDTGPDLPGPGNSEPNPRGPGNIEPNSPRPDHLTEWDDSPGPGDPPDPSDPPRPGGPGSRGGPDGGLGGF
ncbi:hypothetical protein ACWGJB_23095 [Streptomyces sp. NPDC054813]